MARINRTATVALLPTALELAVFMHLDGSFVPAGLLNLTEEGTNVLASAFTYGTRYIERANAAEIDPVSLPLASPCSVAFATRPMVAAVAIAEPHARARADE